MKNDDFYFTNNARHLKPIEVAESFVWSHNFSKLIQNNHTVVLGARGCGKTTLMKMLTLPALNNWRDERAQHIKNGISFYGVYISTDIYWDVKNQTYGSQLQMFGNFSRIISTFSVTSNVFTSLCDTFSYIIEYEIGHDNEEREIELCKNLIRAWKLPQIIPTLKRVKEALSGRIDEVNQLIQNVIFNCKPGDSIPLNEYFDLSFESSVEHIIPVFERIYNLQSKKWALCFDELEFAPLWLQEKLFKSLRSRNQFILYKLSASPVLSPALEDLLKGEYSATTGNDVQIVKMWNSKDNETFSQQIINSLLDKRFGAADSSTYFGTNDIYNKYTKSYDEGSEFYSQVVELARKDISFRRFLESKSVNSENPIMGDKDQRDVLFRKIKPIVYFRNYYISENVIGERNTKRRRKSAELFSGIEVLCKICDGNPRWLIGIINAILSKSNEHKAESAVQAKELMNAALRFKNVIGNIPIGANNTISITTLIDKIGSYFTNQVLGEEFLMDPKSTFEIDFSKMDLAENLVDLIKKGISQGAFTLLDSNDDSFDFDIRGKRIKLSFLFFILYKLPLRNYNSVKLSECLKEGDTQQSFQPKLFE
jgi:hypothetical protein